MVELRHDIGGFDPESFFHRIKEDELRELLNKYGLGGNAALMSDLLEKSLEEFRARVAQHKRFVNDRAAAEFSPDPKKQRVAKELLAVLDMLASEPKHTVLNLSSHSIWNNDIAAEIHFQNSDMVAFHFTNRAYADEQQGRANTVNEMFRDPDIKK